MGCLLGGCPCSLMEEKLGAAGAVVVMSMWALERTDVRLRFGWMDLQVDGYILLSVVNLEMLAVELGAWTLTWWGQEEKGKKTALGLQWDRLWLLMLFSLSSSSSSSSFFFVCVASLLASVGVYTFACVFSWTCVGACRGCTGHSALFFEKESLIEPELIDLARLTSQRTWGNLTIFCFPIAHVPHAPARLAFYPGSEDRNFGP